MTMARYDRVLAIVLDSVGIGAQGDSPAYGDAGAHTLRHALEGSGIELTALKRLRARIWARAPPHPRGATDA